MYGLERRCAKRFHGETLIRIRSGVTQSFSHIRTQFCYGKENLVLARCTFFRGDHGPSGNGVHRVQRKVVSVALLVQRSGNHYIQPLFGGNFLGRRFIQSGNRWQPKIPHSGPVICADEGRALKGEFERGFKRAAED